VRVIPSSLLRIREDFISGLDFGKAACGCLDIVEVAIRMQLESFSTVGSLNPGKGRGVSRTPDFKDCGVKKKENYSSSVAERSTCSSS
jgi:hypothetical protein